MWINGRGSHQVGYLPCKRSQSCKGERGLSYPRISVHNRLQQENHCRIWATVWY
jgi:hypothetical protein